MLHCCIMSTYALAQYLIGTGDWFGAGEVGLGVGVRGGVG